MLIARVPRGLNQLTHSVPSLTFVASVTRKLLILLSENELEPEKIVRLADQARGRFRPPRLVVMRVLSVSLLLFFLAAFSMRAADDLLPPFGFRWNDSMAHVEAVLKGAKAKIVSRQKKEGREIWTVEGLVHPGLKRTVFTFKERGLFGVELEYEYDRPIEWYNQRMGDIRKYFDEKYGTGKLVSRSRDTDTDVIQTLVGYQWMVGATMLQLFYFSAEKGPDHVYRAISVDYKAL